MFSLFVVVGEVTFWMVVISTTAIASKQNPQFKPLIEFIQYLVIMFSGFIAFMCVLLKMHIDEKLKEIQKSV